MIIVLKPDNCILTAHWHSSSLC